MQRWVLLLPGGDWLVLHSWEFFSFMASALLRQVLYYLFMGSLPYPIYLLIHSITALSSLLIVTAPNYSFLLEATTAPKVSHYDYIVVGGGTAGCALAATLSEKHSVLLLERGGSPYGNINISRIETWVDLMQDGSPGSPVQPFRSEDGVVNSRPRVLGGGSSINAAFYSRAQTSYVREVGWDGKLVNESFRWVEKKMAFQPRIRGWQSALRAGMYEAGVRPYNGFTYDHLTGTKVGGTIVDGEGNRHTSADLLEYANPRRITVLIHATVHRVLFNTKGLYICSHLMNICRHTRSHI